MDSVVLGQLQRLVEIEFRQLPGREQLYQRFAEHMSDSLAPRTLDKAFSAQYGCTPFQYLQFIRLQEAQRLLVITKKSQSEIAEAVGLQGRRALHRLFIRYLECSPGAFKQRFKQ